MKYKLGVLGKGISYSLSPEIHNSFSKQCNIDIKYKRSEEYPKISEQLDDLYHQGAFSPEMSARILAVKEKYPKH